MAAQRRSPGRLTMMSTIALATAASATSGLDPPTRRKAGGEQRKPERKPGASGRPRPSDSSRLRDDMKRHQRTHHRKPEAGVGQSAERDQAGAEQIQTRRIVVHSSRQK